MKKSAIITGATGFIGSNLCRKLVECNWDINIIVRKESTLENLSDDIKDKLNIFTYDNSLEDLIAFFRTTNADVVFHLASCFISEHKTSDITDLVRSNIEFGTHVLEAMKFSKTKFMINTGTSWQHYCNDEYNPVCLYAATKEAFENIIKYYVEAESLSIITLKLFDTYGENDNRPKLINLLKKFAEEDKILDMSPGEQLIDLVYIDDVVDAYLKAFEFRLANIDVKYKSFGVSSGFGIKLKDLIKLFENISSKSISINWGKRPYRKREVMSLWTEFDLLPNWKCNTSLTTGLERVFLTK